MRWPSFLLFNTLGTIGWAMLYGVGGYLLGNEINRVGVFVGIALLVLMIGCLLVGRALLRRHEKRLIADGRPSEVYAPTLSGMSDKEVGREIVR